MRFLVDRCAGATLARWLHEHGHDVVYAGDWTEDPGDAAILEIAAQDDRILVTIDTDFGQLIFADERRHRGLVRLPDSPSAQRIEILADLLARHASDLEARAIVTVRGGRARISRPGPGSARP